MSEGRKSPLASNLQTCQSQGRIQDLRRGSLSEMEVGPTGRIQADEVSRSWWPFVNYTALKNELQCPKRQQWLCLGGVRRSRSSYVLCRLIYSEDGKVTCWGRLFQERAAAIGNDRPLTVKRRIARRTYAISGDGAMHDLDVGIITFRVRRNVYWSRPSVSACLCLAVFQHYCTDPDVTWGMVVGRWCTLVVQYSAHLQSVHGFHCYDN